MVHAPEVRCVAAGLGAEAVLLDRAVDIIRDLAAQDAQGFGDGPVTYGSGMEALAAWRREAYETGEGEIAEAIDLLGEEGAAEIYEAARA